MAQVDANKIIDALVMKLAQAQLDATIKEVALADAEATIAQLREDAAELNDIERDAST